MATMIDNPGKAVLVVDDDEFMMNIISVTLGKIGLSNVSKVSSAREACEMIKDPESKFEIVLCDLYMPDMDGIEFIEHLIEMKYRGQVGLISGATETDLGIAEVIGTAHALDFIGIVKKPVSVEALGALLQN